MKAYIIVIVLSIALCVLADFLYRKKKIKASIVFLFLAGLLLCLLAAFRSEYTGRDIHTYLTALFRDFSNGTSLIKEFQNPSAGGVELLFMLLVSAASKTGSLNVVFFVIQLAVVLPVMILAFKLKKDRNVPIALTIFIFLMTMYVYSFSMMRQSIAIAISALSLYFYEKNSKKKSYLLLILAFLFHRTAIVMLGVFIIHKITMGNRKNKALYLLGLIVFGVVIGLLLRQIVGILPAKYSMYLGSRYETSFNFASLIKKIIFIIPAIIMYAKQSKKNAAIKNKILFVIFLIIFDVSFYLFGLKVSEISRACLYFSDIMYFVFVPMIVKWFRPKTVGLLICVVLLSYLWVHMLTVNNEADTYPYRSDIFPALNDGGEK